MPIPDNFRRILHTLSKVSQIGEIG